MNHHHPGKPSLLRLRDCGAVVFLTSKPLADGALIVRPIAGLPKEAMHGNSSQLGSRGRRNAPYRIP
jgi:hypothetical protein